MNQEVEKVFTADNVTFYSPGAARAEIEKLPKDDLIAGLVTITDNGNPHFYYIGKAGHPEAAQVLLAHKDESLDPNFNRAVEVVITKEHNKSIRILITNYHILNDSWMKESKDQLSRGLGDESPEMRTSIVRNIFLAIPLSQRPTTPLEIAAHGIPLTTFNPVSRELTYMTGQQS